MLLLEVGSEVAEDFVLDAGRRLGVVAVGKCLDGSAFFLVQCLRHIDRDVDDFVASLMGVTVDVGARPSARRRCLPS